MTTSNPVFINNDAIFPGEERIILPTKEDESPMELVLDWNHHSTDTSSGNLHKTFLGACAASLKKQFPFSELATIIIKKYAHSAEPAKFVPNLVDENAWPEPLIGGHSKGRYSFMQEKKYMQVAVKDNHEDLNDADLRLAESTVWHGISKHLLGRVAADLNAYAIKTVLQHSTAIVDNEIDDVVRKSVSGYDQFKSSSDSPLNHNVKIMTHPENLREIINESMSDSSGTARTATGVEVLPNWDMPIPSTNSYEILVGDFSQVLLRLFPIRIKISSADVGWNLEASTQIGCGIWSLVKGNIVKAELPLPLYSA